jgi:predicted acylesterase/phospholipase RssA
MAERALVLSASGVRLSYEIAVLKALIERISPEEAAWTHVYGTSGGALLATFLCQYPIGQEMQAVKDMEKLVSKCIGDNGLRSYFPFGAIQGLAWFKSLHSPSFLEETVRENIDQKKLKESGRHLHIMAVDYAESNGMEFTEYHKYIEDAVVGSCSIPLVFPPHPIPDPSSPSGITYLGDGGVTDFIAIERAALNPKIGHIDAILSVGCKEARVFETAARGQYPSIGNIMNTVMEGFYKLAADQTEKTITRINSLVLMKKLKIEDSDMPISERKRISQAANELERNTYVSCRLFRPVTPFSLTTTGYEETISAKLWNSGAASVDQVLSVEKGGIHHILYV